MSRFKRTYRLVNGERIEGTWRPVFIRNGDTFVLSDLAIYADGIIDCWGPVDLAGLEEKLRDGSVATTLPEGGKASAHHLASWTFAEPESWLTPELLLGEVGDEIDRLNDRPDSTGRCLLALRAFRAEPTEANRAALQTAYETIPWHLRPYALGDMDVGDGPLRFLAARLGDVDEPTGRVVTAEMHARALEYFESRDIEAAEWTLSREPDAPDADTASAVVEEAAYPNGWPTEPGLLVLRNEYPAALDIDGVAYPTVWHAYWALAVEGRAARDGILAAPTAAAARAIAAGAGLRPGWPERRLAVMTSLLRAKMQQHPAIAGVLRSTGTGRILYAEGASPFWGGDGESGRHWLGRLLEVVRSELAQPLT